MRSRHADETNRDEAEREVQTEGACALAAAGSERGSLEQAALEIGVTVDELRSWSRDGKAPLFVLVQVEDETAERRALVVFPGSVRVEGKRASE